MTGPTEADLALERLSAAELHRVRLWAEDRLLNIVSPLDLRLQMEMPGVLKIDPTLQAARLTVDRIVALVADVRKLDDQAWIAAAGSRTGRDHARGPVDNSIHQTADERHS